jgi:hypothetical protein
MIVAIAEKAPRLYLKPWGYKRFGYSLPPTMVA